MLSATQSLVCLHSLGSDAALEKPLHKPLESLCGEEEDVLKQGPSSPMIQGTEVAGFAVRSQVER